DRPARAVERDLGKRARVGDEAELRHVRAERALRNRQERRISLPPEDRLVRARAALVHELELLPLRQTRERERDARKKQRRHGSCQSKAERELVHGSPPGAGPRGSRAGSVSSTSPEDNGAPSKSRRRVCRYYCVRISSSRTAAGSSTSRP